MGFSSCDKFLKTDITYIYEPDVLGSPSFTDGLLMNAYNGLPNDYNFGIDVASDDAVSNLQGSVYTRMAKGEWSSYFNPLSQWTNCYQQIFYINKFLSVYESVNFSVDIRNGEVENAKRDAAHKKRLKGEAYALRAFYKWQLLQYHGGKTASGTLLGFPIIDKVLTLDDNWELPRNTFAECINSIFADLDIAIAQLPLTYADKAGDATYNATMGARFENRFNGNAARALKARVALLAASPAFSATSGVTWENAAKISGGLVLDLGPLYATGITFYNEIKNKEIILNRAFTSMRNWEQNNFPPSLFGYGNTNPSQNLVDAFPMKNGYPISHSTSAYNPANPYANRDVRLNEYVIYNGASFKSTIINTYIGAASNGINVLVSSTRTGYYLKKFMAPGVSLNPTSLVSTNHTVTLFRMTEAVLNYAEAANEAWGPDSDGGTGYGSARSKIAAIRVRAGIAAPDPYLASLTTKDQLRELIKNERRIELCFEGFRFWDIRRWNEGATTMVNPIKATYITNTAGVLSYSYNSIEERKYAPTMIYGSIPYSETLKYNIQQNSGW
jgi:hypothetical protein